jgi:hypothetical protein
MRPLSLTNLGFSLTFLPLSSLGDVPLPGSIEVDLLYPHPNATHAVSSPFPVLFSVQNAAMAYEFGITIYYSIYHIEDSEKIRHGSGGMEWSYPGSTFNSPPGPPTEDLFILASNETEELLPGSYFIFWSVERGSSCEGSLWIQHTWDVEIANGTFGFEVAYGAKEPKFEILPPQGGAANATECPQGLAGVVYSDYYSYVAWTDLQSKTTTCPQTGGTLATLTPCAVTVNAAQASSLTRALNLTVIPSEPVITTSSSLTSETSSAVSSSTTSTTTEGSRASRRESMGPRVLLAITILLGVLQRVI